MNNFRLLAIALMLSAFLNAPASAAPLNVLLITVDDMNCDSVGVFGCPIKGMTPHIDRLASQGMRFEHAHVTVAICQPTRAVWMTGRYPHNSGALGFDRIKPGVPTLVEALREAGYYTGIMAKTGHVVPSRARAWNESVPARKLGNGRDPQKYYQHAKAFLANAQRAKQPFFLMANAQDPHRPFHGSRQEMQFKQRDRGNKNHQYGGGFPGVSKVYQPAEILVPGFLPDIPDVRKEVAQYYTSVHRADEVVGDVLRALDESGMADGTLVMFLSDHGMPLPFAKTNVWRHSTRTSWIVRWPKVATAGVVDERHFITGVDLTPTILDALDIEPLKAMDGRSFLPVLKGQQQQGREEAFTHINTIASKRSYAMRSIQDARFGYIYNAWPDGETRFRNESQSGLTMAAMQRAARNDPKIAARVKHFLFRSKEELYDYQQDGDALRNLAGDPEYAETLRGYRRRMQAAMKRSDDFLLGRFEEDVPLKDGQGQKEK